jgi:2-polyprenyl-3-methyl-5-hydroxy-6-metoxy-1,4-benzoquinol methylase
MGEIIEHIKYPEQAIKDVLKLLNDDGILIITTPVGFAHYSQDHINIFLIQEYIKIIQHLWISYIFPNCINDLTKVYDIKSVLDLCGYKYDLKIYDWKDSKYPCWDFYAIIYKNKVKTDEK